MRPLRRRLPIFRTDQSIANLTQIPGESDDFWRISGVRSGPQHAARFVICITDTNRRTPEQKAVSNYDIHPRLS